MTYILLHVTKQLPNSTLPCAQHTLHPATASGKVVNAADVLPVLWWFPARDVYMVKKCSTYFMPKTRRTVFKTVDVFVLQVLCYT